MRRSGTVLLGIRLGFRTSGFPVPAKALRGSAPAELGGDSRPGEAGDCDLGNQASRVGVEIGKKHLPSPFRWVCSAPALTPAVERGLQPTFPPSTVAIPPTWTTEHSTTVPAAARSQDPAAPREADEDGAGHCSTAEAEAQPPSSLILGSPGSARTWQSLKFPEEAPGRSCPISTFVPEAVRSRRGTPKSSIILTVEWLVARPDRTCRCALPLSSGAWRSDEGARVGGATG